MCDDMCLVGVCAEIVAVVVCVARQLQVKNATAEAAELDFLLESEFSCTLFIFYLLIARRDTLAGLLAANRQLHWQLLVRLLMQLLWLLLLWLLLCWRLVSVHGLSSWYRGC